VKRARLILASASPRRRALLKQIGIVPDEIGVPEIDETPKKSELPAQYAIRLAAEKAAGFSREGDGALVLAADTVVACGRRILPKAEDVQTARQCLALLSGRSHRVYTAVALAGPAQELCLRVVETRVKVRRLGEDDINDYLKSGEWCGKAGGYAIQGMFAAHVISIIGSYTNVVGLPLYETANLLRGAGWSAA